MVVMKRYKKTCQPVIGVDRGDRASKFMFVADRYTALVLKEMAEQTALDANSTPAVHFLLLRGSLCHAREKMQRI